jgi:threonine synthase
MTILYQSTRGRAHDLDLRAVTLSGLAPDGGLYVPKKWPEFSASDLAAMKGLSYQDVAFRVLKDFTEDAIPDDALKDLIRKAYASFTDPAVVPLKQLDDRLWILELFHGPTLAFKDVALQLLGHLFEYFLARDGRKITVIGATSGDTGPAAMNALAGRGNIEVFILFPAKGPSELQRRQMTCLAASNVHALAIEGSFDDCQALVKSLMGDAVLREKYAFAAVNSINWTRLLAQMVYYVAAGARFAPKPVSFSVPTGNFGNIYAAYAASKRGLAVSKLATASNANDVLTRFFASGRMQAGKARATLSPSMDIQVSSNFERLLFDLSAGDAKEVRRLMNDLKGGAFTVTRKQLAAARQIFTAASVDDAETLAAIRMVNDKYGYLLDPHGAVGVAAAQKLARELPEPVICLATAHPAKFPEAVQRATGKAPPPVKLLTDLLKRPERMIVLPPHLAEIERYIGKVISDGDRAFHIR